MKRNRLNDDVFAFDFDLDKGKRPQIADQNQVPGVSFGTITVTSIVQIKLRIE